MSNIRVRFAPSPTGYLHIGSARTALFNYLFARHHKGKFLLRVEDTDRERSTKEAIDAIFTGLAWLGINYDEEPVFQFARANRHKEVALELVTKGKAFKCYHSKEELEEMRAKSLESGKPLRSIWREKSESEAPQGVAPTIRLRVPIEGKSSISDRVQGIVEHENTDFEDTILLRSDGTPTYMLAVVVDDHDMGITHIIRGDDHLTNSFRQKFIYEAMNWNIPEFAHIPLIHGQDGAKLSKRHGALGVESYRDMGFLAQTMRNYLVRLGWSHGNEEIFSDEQAIEWFNLEAIGKSPSRLDFKKMEFVNAHYIKHGSNQFLLEMLEKDFGFVVKIDHKLLDLYKNRAKTMLELKDSLNQTINYHENIEREAEIIIEKLADFSQSIKDLISKIDSWNKDDILLEIKNYIAQNNISMSDISGFLRAKILGVTNSPSIYEIMEILGKNEVLRRIS